MRFEKFLSIYDQIFQSAQEVYEEYQDQLEKLTEQTNSLTVSKEYARGGLGFGLGCYSVNPMEEYVVGGVHLGHLLKRIHTAKKPDWEYCFDELGRLIAARENLTEHGDIHFIIRGRDAFVWDIVYDTFERLGRISVYFFEHNRLEMEVRFSAYSFGNEKFIISQVMYDVWIFEYLDDGFIEFEHFSDLLYPERAKGFLEQHHLDWHRVRTVYRRHPNPSDDKIEYDLYELDETTGQSRFFTTRMIDKCSLELSRAGSAGSALTDKS